jgi:acetyl-CoA carboxylase carboxyl transferase subunit beta
LSWLRRKKPKVEKQTKLEMPKGLWIKCDGCGEIIFHKELERNLWTCTSCRHHFRIPAKAYVKILLDEGSLNEIFPDIESSDPLRFVDSKPYTKRLRDAKEKTGVKSAILTGRGEVEKIPVMIGIMDFAFLGGSMGSAVGEKIYRLVEAAIDGRMPVVIVTASGGARMQEGMFSLMQLAKTSAVLGKLSREKLPFIVIQTDPTTGGVTASYGMLGDVIIAEPHALVGFAGPRVIKQTIKQDLPEGFQRSEFLLEHGMVDMVIHRKEMKSTLAKILSFFSEEVIEEAQ